jgi:hypothetical protein
MKISIGINNFKLEKDLNHREKMCVESLHKLKKQFPENVELINLTFEDEKFAVLNDFVNLHCLKQTSSITTKKIPFVNEIFNNLSKINSDYFLFVNNDIVVSNRYIKHILKGEYDCYPAS